MKFYNSCLAGILDTLKELKRDDLWNGTEFEYPNEDKGELDPVAYLRGMVEALVMVLKERK